MRMQPYMIDIRYDHNAPLSKEKTLPICQLTKVEPVKFDMERECWYTENHYRRQVKDKNGKWQTRMLQIAIGLEDEDLAGVKVYFASSHDDQTELRELSFHPQEMVWYEHSRFRNKKEGENFYRYDHRDWVTGVAHAGTLDIIVKRNGVTVSRQPITFYPSAISMENYNVMISDLFRIHEDLVRRNKTTVAIGSVKERTPKQLEKVIQELEGPIHAINANPASALSFRWELGKPGHGEKFRLRTEMEQQMNPGKSKYRVFKAYESVAMVENKIIKQQLIRLKNYCAFYQSAAPLMKAYDTQKINEMNLILEKGSPRLKRLIGEHPVEKVSSQEYHAYIQALTNELQTIDQQIAEKETAMLERLKSIKSPPQINVETVPIKIDCTIHTMQMNKDFHLGNNRLTTIFSSLWRDRIATLEYDGYCYHWDGKAIAVPAASLFLTIENRSPRLTDHWKLWKAFHQGVQALSDEEKDVSMEIYGQAICRKMPSAGNPDIIGEEQENSNYRKYEFDLTEITTIKVNGNAFEYDVSPDVLYEELARFSLENDKERERLEARRMDITFDMKTLAAMQKIAHELEQLAGDGLLYESLAAKIDSFLSLPLFQSIDITGTEQLKPTQLFQHDPYYRSIWSLLHDLQEEIGLSLIPEASSNQFGVQKVEQVYETWILYKMLHLLTTEMGWTMEEYEDAVRCLESFITPRRKNILKGFHVTLRQRDWSINIAYEPDLKVWKDVLLGETDDRKPDFVFRIYHKKMKKGIIYLDAKHRNYFDQGEIAWKHDIEEVAIEKYGTMTPADSEWNLQLLGSFLIHSDAAFGMKKERSGESYFAYYNRKHFPDKINAAYPEDVHKYGSIYLLPSAVHAFKNWFRLMMEFRIGAYEICWNCGCDNVEIEERYTRKGYPKYYYTCNHCGEFWVKNHCTKGHKIVKHFNNYHRQMSSDYTWGIVCPTCGDGFDREKPDSVNAPTRYVRNPSSV